MKKIFILMFIIILTFPVGDNVSALKCSSLNMDDLKDDTYVFTGRIIELESNTRALVVITNNYSNEPINETVTIFDDMGLWARDFSEIKSDEIFVVGNMIHENLIRVSPCHFSEVVDNRIEISIGISKVIYDEINIEKLDKYKGKIIKDNTGRLDAIYLLVILPIISIFIFMIREVVKSN